MLRVIERFLLNISNIKYFLLILMANGVQAYFLFSQWGNRFYQITGEKVYDLQPFLTPDVLYQQLSKYTDEAIAVYWKFVALDYLFPVTGALANVVLLGMILRRCNSSLAGTLLKTGLWLVPLGIIPFDWLENTGFIFLIRSFPDTLLWLARITCWSKYCKMFFVLSLNIVVVVGVATYLWEKLFSKKA